MIPEDFIQTLLSRVDVVEVIDRRVPLKKAGANFVACCPFHQEKSPSFSVSPSKQFYHCFGCGAHGTAIGFVMEFHAETFPEAVESLAKEVGLTVPHLHENSAEYANRKTAPDHYALMQTAADFYKKSLKTSDAAIDYLKKRGLSGDIARRFGLGFAPDSWQPLKQAFPDYDTSPALDTLGLITDKEGNNRYDRFRARVMFPILDARGRVIAFGGRVLDNSDPKYLNSPETPLFSKGRELYGLFLARDAIKKEGSVIVVEGYMDVVALAQHGVENCVATLGTATTPFHAAKLFRLTDHVIFSFDSDEAGKKAAWRALINTLPALKDNKRASFLFLADGKDPDEFIRKHGREAFLDAAKNAQPLSDFLLAHEAHDLDSDEGRASFTKAVAPLIAEIREAPALAALLRRRVTSMTGLPEQEVIALQPKPKRQHASYTFPETRTGGRVVPRGLSQPSLYHEILRAILHDPHLAITHEIPTIDDKTPVAVTLSEVVAYCQSWATPPSVSLVAQHFEESPHARVIHHLLGVNLNQPLEDEQNALNFQAALIKLVRHNEDKRFEALKGRPFSELSHEERQWMSAHVKQQSDAPLPSPFETPKKTTENLTPSPRKTRVTPSDFPHSPSKSRPDATHSSSTSKTSPSPVVNLPPFEGEEPPPF